MALLFRAYFASAYGGYIQKTSAGVPVNAVHGFVKYFWDAVERFEPSHVACCWDMGSTTFRTEKYPDYKGNRPEAPDELIPQFSLVKEVVESFGVPNIGIHGFEADDCIGTLSRHFAGDAHVYILSGDHDLLQLVNDDVTVVIMKKGFSNYAVYNPQLLQEEKGLTPPQVIDMKGLMGDTSDNYPGVKGIGEKTALKLVQEYGSIDGILANIDKLPKGVRTKIEAELDMLHLSRELATILTEVPVTCDWNECRWSVDRGRVLSKFEELEFKGLRKIVENSKVV
ncbi:5'-3' exonuclease [Paenibacillus thalictri]|uniref:5'-3' exonuclease n=2 Tax=Paenibacillus thalictri TaxID=2527873 RepID=A0A4Q9DFK7_9BACL|nr:5'-3' exonuclease [Paenibacillus thalictri]